MEMTKEIFGVWIFFKLKGRLDMKTAPEFEKEILPEIEKRMDIALDFSELEFISSMVIRSIMTAIKKLHEVHHHIAICGMKDEVKNSIELTGINHLVEVYEKLSDLPFASDIPDKYKKWHHFCKKFLLRNVGDFFWLHEKNSVK